MFCITSSTLIKVLTGKSAQPRAKMSCYVGMLKNYEHMPDVAACLPCTILGKGVNGATFMMREIATGHVVAVKQLSGT